MVNGKMENAREKLYIKFKMNLNMKGISKTIKKMDMELKNIMMALNTKEISRIIKKMVMGYISFQMEKFMRGNL